MPRFVFDVTEEEWQRLSLVLTVSYVDAGESAGDTALTFDDALRQIFLFGLYHLERNVLGGSDHDQEGELGLPPDVAGGIH